MTIFFIIPNELLTKIFIIIYGHSQRTKIENIRN